jgi:hypothetical protein
MVIDIEHIFSLNDFVAGEAIQFYQFFWGYEE